MLNPFFMGRWVKPFYLQILHGNYAFDDVVGDDRERFNADVRQALESITPAIATKLIRGHWRYAITGSWFAGMKQFTECQEEIGALLLASKYCYAGQSHAFAMACFANDKSVDHLKAYLDKYLRKPDCYYDQNWAMPALMWIDQANATNHAAQYLLPDGLWDQFIADKMTPSNDAWSIDYCKEQFWKTMGYCREHFL